MNSPGFRSSAWLTSSTVWTCGCYPARVKLVVASFMQPLAECRWSTNAS
jgi:hypothetical protein